MKNLKIEYNARAILGEGPVWDHRTGRLIWVDIIPGRVHLYDPLTRTERELSFGKMVSIAIPTDKGRLLLGLQDGLYLCEMNGSELRCLSDLEAEIPTNRFNDGKCDRNGRFWVGTMDINARPGAGSLYTISGRKISRQLEALSVPNGIAWPESDNLMYFIDSALQQVNSYEIEEQTCRLRLLAESRIPEDLGTPDGMTIDRSGMLWIAMWGGGRVIHWDPAKSKLLDEIQVPAKNVTSCTFGGPGLDELYITTASLGSGPEDQQYTHNGALFSVKLPCGGYGVNYFLEE